MFQAVGFTVDFGNSKDSRYNYDCLTLKQGVSTSLLCNYVSHDRTHVSVSFQFRSKYTYPSFFHFPHQIATKEERERKQTFEEPRYRQPNRTTELTGRECKTSETKSCNRVLSYVAVKRGTRGRKETIWCTVARVKFR